MGKRRFSRELALKFLYQLEFNEAGFKDQMASFEDRLSCQEEVKEWEERDPVITFPKKLIEMGLVTQDQVNEIKSAVDESVAKAVEFANESPEPDLSEINTDVLA